MPRTAGNRTAMRVVASVVGVLSLASCSAGASSEGASASRPLRLEDPSVYVVYHATDRDAQVFVKVGRVMPYAIQELTVKDPSGRVVAKASSTDRGDVGLADVVLETPEPSLAALKAAYPSGPTASRDGPWTAGV